MPRRKKAQREKDLVIISDRYLKGEFQSVIAKDLGVSQRTISKDLKELQRRWLESSLRNYDQSIAEELAKVDNLEREYWDAWEASKEDEETETIEQVNKPDGVGKSTIEHIKKNVRKQGKTGNPQFLKGIEWCIDRRCKILGLDAPTKTKSEHELFGKDGEPLAIKSEINTITLRQYIEKKE